MIEKIAEWRNAVPRPLAVVAASELCGDDGEPCVDCVEEAVNVLAHAYGFSPYPDADHPCPACRAVRESPLDLAASCLFHQGVDQGIVSGLDPVVTIVRPVKKRPRWWHGWWGRLWTHDFAALASSVVVAVIVVAIYVGVVALLVK